MSDKKELLKEAITLPPRDRAYLIDRLLVSLDRPDREIEKLWAKEAESRIDAYDRGELKAVTLEKVLEKYK